MTWKPTKFTNEPPVEPFWDYEIATDSFRYLEKSDITNLSQKESAYWAFHHAMPALTKMVDMIANGETDHRFSIAKLIATGKEGYDALVKLGLITEST